MTFQELPTEIASIVFHFLPGPLAYQSIFVCKSWHLHATRAYYSTLSLSTESCERLQVSLQNNWVTFRAGKWTKVLRIYKKYEYSRENVVKRMGLEEFTLLLSHLPNLTTIDLTSSQNVSYYVKLLHDVETVYLQNIQEICLGSYMRDSRRDLFPLFYKFRKTLTLLEMEYEYIKLDKENIYGLSLLVNFTSLSRLVIYSYSTSNLSVTDILNNCPNIVSLDFSSYYAVPDSVYNLVTNMKQTKLKNIKLAIPTLTKSCMNYLSRCLVLDKLETFNINLTEEEMYGMLNREGIDNVLKMARQLSSVKNIKLYANPENDGTFELPNPEDRMTILYSLIHALQGNRVMNCFATYSDSKPLEFSISISNGEKLNFLYGISRSDYTPDYENRSLSINEFPMPDKNVSIIGPDIINKLLFIIVHPTEIFAPNFLQYVVLNCPHASSLTITSWNNHSSYEVEAEKDTAKIVLKASIMPSQEVLGLLSSFLPEAKKFKIETPRGCDQFVADKFTIDFTIFRFLEKLTINVHNSQHTVQIAFVSMRFADDDTIDTYKITPVNGPNSGFKLLPVNEREYSNSSKGSLIINLHRIETVKFKSELFRKPIATFRFGELISSSKDK